MPQLLIRSLKSKFRMGSPTLEILIALLCLSLSLRSSALVRFRSSDLSVCCYRCSDETHIRVFPPFRATEPPSPTVAAANGGGDSSQSCRRNLHSPWASVVRGDSDQIIPSNNPPGPSVSPPPEQGSAPPDELVIESSGSEAQPENSDADGDGNAGRSRRPVWSRPQNGVVESGSVIGGPTSWPALSESTRPISRSSSDASKPAFDGSASLPQAPIISQPPQRQANNSSHSNSTANNTARPRARSRGGGGTSSGSGPPHNTFHRPSPPTPPPFPMFEAPYGMVPPIVEAPVAGTRPIRGSQSHTGNGHSSQRNNNNNSRRGNFGPRPRGEGHYHNNHGGRRDQDRRDVHLPQQYMPPPPPPPPLGYIQPPPLPPGAAPFMGPPHVRVFPGPMGFDMVPSMYYVPTMSPAMPIVPPPPTQSMPFPPANENLLRNMIIKQIDYYFSDENLVKDSFLRSKMDPQGWVSITLIANFPRVQQLTKDVTLILDSLKHSTIVEVQGEKLRRQNDWNKWLHPPGWANNESAAQSPGNVLSTSLQEVSLYDSTANSNGNIHVTEAQTGTVTTKPSSEGPSKLPNGEDTAEETSPRC